LRVDVDIPMTGKFSCPKCDRSWNIKGRKGATGFIIAAAKSHIANCHLKKDVTIEFCEVCIHNLGSKRGVR